MILGKVQLASAQDFATPASYQKQMVKKCKV